ncbi:reverse transcriptase domain-containing protein [Tanacetum coccineum]
MWVIIVHLLLEGKSMSQDSFGLASLKMLKIMLRDAIRIKDLETYHQEVGYLRTLFRLFARFGIPKALISDRGTHFCNSQLEKALQKYEVTHKLSTRISPQLYGQAEVTNKAVKRILKRLVGYNLKNWSKKVDDALWAFRIAYKTPTACTPFRLVYGKACHLLVEIEHKAYWALKQCNMDLIAAAKNRFMELNELMDIRDGAYANTRIYKERTKRWHDSRLRGDKNFKVGDKTVYLYGTVEIIDRNGISFKVNGQRLKKYHDGHIEAEDKEVVEFREDTSNKKVEGNKSNLKTSL